MKESKGFADFLSEEKKESSPKKSSKKKKERKQSNGKDDQRYIALMDEYKRTRGKDRKEANKIMAKCLVMRRRGDVSKDAILGGQYI